MKYAERTNYIQSSKGNKRKPPGKTLRTRHYAAKDALINERVMTESAERVTRMKRELGI